MSEQGPERAEQEETQGSEHRALASPHGHLADVGIIIIFLLSHQLHDTSHNAGDQDEKASEDSFQEVTALEQEKGSESIRALVSQVGGEGEEEPGQLPPHPVKCHTQEVRQTQASKLMSHTEMLADTGALAHFVPHM